MLKTGLKSFATWFPDLETMLFFEENFQQVHADSSQFKWESKSERIAEKKLKAELSQNNRN